MMTHLASFNNQKPGRSSLGAGWGQARWLRCRHTRLFQLIVVVIDRVDVDVFELVVGANPIEGRHHKPERRAGLVLYAHPIEILLAVKVDGRLGGMGIAGYREGRVILDLFAH